jgi:adenine-specific DNA-methyltransferase
MPIKYIPYKVEPLRGQAVLPFLRYHRQLTSKDFHLKGMPYFEVEPTEKVNHVDEKQSDNLLIHGDCLNACAYLKEQGITVDLVYIDPPFASGANYAKKIYIRQNPELVTRLEQLAEELVAQATQAGEEVDNKDLQALEETVYGDIWQKEDYLNWLYERLLAIKEVMRDTASIYVHLDWHIGHYVKVLMDEVFGEENFRNEIIWHYSGWNKKLNTSFVKRYDSIFYYSKSDAPIFNSITEEWKSKEEYVKKRKQKILIDENDKEYVLSDAGNGRRIKRYLEDALTEGFVVDDVWDIDKVNNSAKESTDYETQKPEALLERIIKANSKEGMVVADFFGGSGVAAKVAYNLGRIFITADVGINAIQTMRDRLVGAKASFDILKIKDGIDLFRNPQQTMDRLAGIIPSLSTQHDFGSFWFGSITDKGTVCPCWVPDLKDKGQAILNPGLFSKILDETAKLDGISKVVVCSVDQTDEVEIKKMIKDYDLRDSDGKPVQFVFKDLKELIDLIVSPDVVEYTTTEEESRYVITFDRFISDALIQKFTEFNAKKKADQKKIEISDKGLELIEFVSVDSTNADGVWLSEHEIKIDKNSYLIVNGEQTKQFWDGTVTVNKKPLRIKVRNIAGDETISKVD